jgi:DNA-binding FadR family transcriptional regulator
MSGGNQTAELQVPATEEVGLVSSAIGAVTRLMRERQLAPGDRLPSESELARDLGVSRTVVREAYRSLSAMRLIELSAGRRARVAAIDYSAMSPLIEHCVSTEQINIQQIYDVRRTIETRTSALAALRRSDDEGASILRNAEGMHEHFDDTEKVMEFDLAFHREIAHASRNPVFALIVGAFDGVSKQTWPIGWRSRKSDKERRAMIDIHVDLAKAIVAGDPQTAQDHMARHFDQSVRALLDAGIG